jgi:hypothetical protein
LSLEVFLPRRHPAKSPPDIGFVLRLHFDAPVTGPISLGYAAHFGLGCSQPSTITANVNSAL